MPTEVFLAFDVPRCKERNLVFTATWLWGVRPESLPTYEFPVLKDDGTGGDETADDCRYSARFDNPLPVDAEPGGYELLFAYDSSCGGPDCTAFPGCEGGFDVDVSAGI
ncbi:MAG TPA: choice-of-anchor X domain-containing protein [Myxococcota bacterium]|nr:choice-of-anchor X domain-containing protein [Myxococcota bacterium]